MGKLHDELKETGYDGHPLEHFLVRLLFLLFAEDTSIFEKMIFTEFIENRTHEDGSDVGAKLAELFQVLNTPEDKRLKTRDDSLAVFPYVNGKLFAEFLPIVAFDAKMRETLIECCYIDWSKISPAIFGSLFQSIMDKILRILFIGAICTNLLNSQSKVNVSDIEQRNVDGNSIIFSNGEKLNGIVNEN